MIRVAAKTHLKIEDIIGRASAFFGEGGEGLKETERHPCCISFEGGDGYVTVSVVQEDSKNTVDVEAREFEYQAKQFLQTL